MHHTITRSGYDFYIICLIAVVLSRPDILALTRGEIGLIAKCMCTGSPEVLEAAIAIEDGVQLVVVNISDCKFICWVCMVTQCLLRPRNEGFFPGWESSLQQWRHP